MPYKSLKKILKSGKKLKLGKNFENSNEVVYFEKVFTKWQGNCFKISVSSNDSEIAISKVRGFYLHFNQSIFMNVYITSKVNSNGVIFNDWKDGRAMKVSFGIPDFLKLVDLKSNEYRYSKTKKNCRLVILVYGLGKSFNAFLVSWSSWSVF